jgi:hypothetical protein
LTFFELSSWAVALLLLAAVLGTTGLGLILGRRHLSERQREPFGVRTAHVAALDNRVPDAVIALEVIGAAVALGLLAAYLAVLGRGMATVMIAAG